MACVFKRRTEQVEAIELLRNSSPLARDAPPSRTRLREGFGVESRACARSKIENAVAMREGLSKAGALTLESDPAKAGLEPARNGGRWRIKKASPSIWRRWVSFQLSFLIASRTAFSYPGSNAQDRRC